MAKQSIGVGAAPNDGTGDSIRAAFTKVTSNFDETYAASVQMTRLDKTAGYTATSADLAKFLRFDATSGALVAKLPAAGAVDGDWINFRKTDASANRVTVQDNGGATDLAWLSAQNDEVTFTWWGGAWVASDWRIQPLRVVFTSSGTLTKPPLVASADVILFGAGGGGGAGRRNTSAAFRVGGQGGNPGNGLYINLPASAFGATEAVTVGAGGAGGAAPTGDNAGGAPGSNGGDTTLGTSVFARAGGGLGGSGGSSSAIAAALTNASMLPVSTTTSNTGDNAQPSAAAIGAGGSGGYTSNSNVVALPAQGGNGSCFSGTATAGGAAGTSGATGTNGSAGTNVSDTNLQLGGGGGGGGGAGNAGAAGAGGNGGTPGGGGGGSGGQVNGFTGGNGGTGARGEVRVVWYFV